MSCPVGGVYKSDYTAIQIQYWYVHFSDYTTVSSNKDAILTRQDKIPCGALTDSMFGWKFSYCKRQWWENLFM